MSGTARSTVPIVFLNGANDPVDPPANVAGATATMPNALLVPVPDSGHWTLNLSPHPACLLANTTAFIQAGEARQPSTLGRLHPRPGPGARAIPRTLKRPAAALPRSQTGQP